MGNDPSSPAAQYKKQLLKLSWRLVLTVQEQADMGSKHVSRETSRTSMNQTFTIAKRGESMDMKSTTSFLSGRAPEQIRPFHESFMESFFKYCPDLKSKFPSNYSLVSRMIQTFISNSIETKDVSKLAKSFAKSHQKHNLKSEHFQGFSEALSDTIQSRLGKFGTIELVKIWRDVTNTIVKALEKEYFKLKTQSGR
uniref:Globin domain-containing protein n=1 Tax=Lotharella globosa TaxID=91324 RepID=A0A6U2X9W3_9EUKA